MNIDALKTQLLETPKTERAALVTDLVQNAAPEDWPKITQWLLHAEQSLREAALIAIEKKRYRPALGALAAVAKGRSGNERARALLALCAIADKSDTPKLSPLLELITPEDDPAHDIIKSAQRGLALVLKKSAHSDDNPIAYGLLSTVQSVRRQALTRVMRDAASPRAVLVESLLESEGDAIRMDLVTGLGMLPASELAAGAVSLIEKGDDDLIALVARCTVRKLKEADQVHKTPIANALRKSAKGVNSLVTQMAIDSCALALDPKASLSDLAQKLGTLDEDALGEVQDALLHLSDQERVAALQSIVSGLEAAPQRVGIFAEMLYQDLDRLDVLSRTRLGAICVKASRGEGDDRTLAKTQGPLARLYARSVLPGGPLPQKLAMGLELSSNEQDKRALIDLCLALSTEESAAYLLKMSKKNNAAAEHARTALQVFDSNEVDVLFHPDRIELSLHFEVDGQRLASEGRLLKDAQGNRYVLSLSGQPLRQSQTPHGGCACCYRARALDSASEDKKVPQNDRFPRCPVTSEKHLISDEGNVLLDSHPLGPCTECESVRPLERSGEKVSCPFCHSRFERKGDAYVARKARPESYMYTDAAFERSEAIPHTEKSFAPPKEEDVNRLPMARQNAMRANVALLEQGASQGYLGTGIVVGRMGNSFAVLTARHAVESTRGPEKGMRRPLSVMCIDGQKAPARLLWVAARGVDLALLEVTFESGESLVPITLEHERRPSPGEAVFAIANEMNFPWSYYQGHVSAVRDLPTTGGIDVRYMQTPMVLPAGTGGGGIYFDDGRLAALISWHQMVAANDTNFAITIDSICAALRREKVKFQGDRLVS